MISDDIVAQFQRDGAVCIRQLFRADEIEQLRTGIELNLARPVRGPDPAWEPTAAATRAFGEPTVSQRSPPS